MIEPSPSSSSSSGITSDSEGDVLVDGFLVPRESRVKPPKSLSSSASVPASASSSASAPPSTSPSASVPPPAPASGSGRPPASASRLARPSALASGSARPLAPAPASKSARPSVPASASAPRENFSLASLQRPSQHQEHYLDIQKLQQGMWGRRSASTSVDEVDLSQRKRLKYISDQIGPVTSKKS